jgi:hypothetical protein
LDFVSEERSITAFKRHSEESLKFDYFITGLNGALCAYIVQGWKPQKLDHLGPELLEVSALVLLFLAAVAGFKRIETSVFVLTLNHTWLHSKETRGAMMKVINECGGRVGYNLESGDVVTPQQAMMRYEALTSEVEAVKEKLDKVSGKALRWYKWRNRLLLSGFLILLIARSALML